MKKTKIIATIGPASVAEKILEKMILSRLKCRENKHVTWKLYRTFRKDY